MIVSNKNKNKNKNVSSSPKDSNIESLELAQESMILNIPREILIGGSLDYTWSMRRNLNTLDWKEYDQIQVSEGALGAAWR